MSNHTLQQFHTIAIQHKLSAAAILLWQHIYFAAQAKGKYTGLCLRTADVVQVLSLTRNGLQKVRRTLVNAGLLQVRIDARQQVYYTLMMDGKTVATNKKDYNDIDNNGETTVGDDVSSVPQKPISINTARPFAKSNYSANSTINNDIIHNNAYRKMIDAFCAQYDDRKRNMLASVLTQFFYRRKQLGRTLTKAGLDALLYKLVILAEGKIHAMIDIVQQSITRGWLGFYPYKPCMASVSNGDTVCRGRRLGGPEPYKTQSKYNVRPPRTPKYDTKYEDLDYLEW